jgi:hypothetical protein
MNQSRKKVKNKQKTRDEDLISIAHVKRFSGRLDRPLEALRLQEAIVLRRLVAAQARETTQANTPEEDIFRISCRVQIINSVRTPFGRSRTTLDNRRAIVTRITNS